jgi:peptidoglycan/LPS O-acetylase OafA/YrhL
VSSATATASEDNLPDEKPPVVGAQRSIAEALGGRHNALGFIRLVLAALVILDHACALGGYGGDPLLIWTHGQAELGDIAVGGFFAISGYLIAKSGMSADILQFLWRRFLRIFPGYWTLLILTAFVIVPIVWIVQGENIARYFTLAGGGPFSYVKGNWTLNINAYGIYDVFAKTTPYGRAGYGSVLNGSIWSLIYEWTCYLLVGALLVFGILRRARIVVPLVTAFLFVLQVVLLVKPSVVATLVPWLSNGLTISLTLTFMYGACIAVYSKRVPYSHGLGILSGVLMVATLFFGGYQLIGVPASVYFILYLGARLPARLQRVGSKNDYSYGVYIYGFLVEQIFAALGLYRSGYVIYTLVSLIVSLGMGWISWHLVEKRAMSLKDWGPGRGIRSWRETARARWNRAPLAEE